MFILGEEEEGERERRDRFAGTALVNAMLFVIHRSIVSFQGRDKKRIEEL